MFSLHKSDQTASAWYQVRTNHLQRGAKAETESRLTKTHRFLHSPLLTAKLLREALQTPPARQHKWQLRLREGPSNFQQAGAPPWLCSTKQQKHPGCSAKILSPSAESAQVCGSEIPSKAAPRDLHVPGVHRSSAECGVFVSPHQGNADTILSQGTNQEPLLARDQEFSRWPQTRAWVRTTGHAHGRNSIRKDKV